MNDENALDQVGDNDLFWSMLEEEIAGRRLLVSPNSARTVVEENGQRLDATAPSHFD